MSVPIVLRTDAELNMGASWPASSSNAFRVITAENDEVETILNLVPEADLIFTCYAPLTAEVLTAGKRLRGIVKYGVGVDSIDVDAASELGIPVVHCPDYGTDTVADQAFALLISSARRITQLDQGMRKAGWLWPSQEYQGVDLTGKTLGIIGFGRIGKAMARRAGGFGMCCLVCDPFVPHDTEGWSNLRFTQLEEVLQEADFLSLHCVLTEQTREIIDRNALQLMKKSALLINVSRGALIDPPALVEALQAGQIAGAGLDVFVDEPLNRKHPLYQLNNVIVSPHFAFYTCEAHERLESQCLVAVTQLLADRLPDNVKNFDALVAHGIRDPFVITSAEQIEKPAEGGRHAGQPPVSTNGKGPPEPWRYTEGDVNFSPERADWQRDHINKESQELLDRDARVFLHQSLSTPCLTSIVECEGSYLIDEQGKRYLDFHGNSAHQVGHRNPRVLNAIQEQLKTLPFCPRRFTNRPAIQLAEKLAELAPGRLNKVLFAPGGTSVIGIAMKLARYVTGRHKTISMWDSFHGASLDAISIGGERLFRDGLGPLLPGCFHVPWPREAGDANAIEEILTSEGDIGAVIAEPLRCTTLERPSPAYWKRVRQLCDEHGALLIFDEIPTALGRTGRMFCCEHFDVVPDMLVLGKGLGGGVVPMAAILAREDLDVAANCALGHYTHEKSPLGAAAALATIDVIESEGLLDRATMLGEISLTRLQAIQRTNELVADVRGIGLALGVELAVDGTTAGDTALKVLYNCLANGLSFKVSGGNVLTLTPPLTITEPELDRALGIVEQAIASVAAGGHSRNNINE